MVARTWTVLERAGDLATREPLSGLRPLRPLCRDPDVQ
jgi:hypothetical protein